MSVDDSIVRKKNTMEVNGDHQIHGKKKLKQLDGEIDKFFTFK